MIQTTDEFHEVANGQVRPLDWESAIAFQMTEGEPYEIEGSLSQEHRYIGKNQANIASLVNGAVVLNENNGFKLTKINDSTDGRISATMTFPTPIQANTQITISYEVLEGSTGCYVQWLASDGTNIWSPNLSVSQTSTTATFAKPIAGLRIYFQNGQTNGIYFSVNNFMIRYSGTSADFEPYVGGVPSPSPYAPEPITTKTGNIIVSHDGHPYQINLGDIELAKIGIYEDIIFYSTGKNIAKLATNTNRASNYEVFTSAGNVKISSNRVNESFDLCGGTIIGNWLPTVANANDYNLTPNGGTYTISAQEVTGTLSGTQNLYVTIFTNTRQVNTFINAEVKDVSNTITLADSEHIKSIYLWTGANTTYDLTFKVQLEAGEEATTYEPYANGLEGWCILKKTNKVSYVDSDISQAQSYASVIYARCTQPTDSITYGTYLNSPIAYSTHATGKTYLEIDNAWNSAKAIGAILSGAATNQYWIGFNLGTTLEQMKSALAGASVYYVLKTPTYEEITDENLLTQLNAPLQPRPDYMDVKNRTISISTSRSVEFPHTVQSATCDLELDNHDKKFSYSNHSELGPYILPNRPMAIELGFKEVGTVPHFYGNTIMPKYQGEFEEVATFTANDDLSKLGENHLPNMIMLRDVRTDEAIEAILVDLGVPSDKYELEEGANRIPFVYFDADKSVGNALKELVQAENGALWQDEKGIIRFAARNTNAFSQDPVMVFDKTNTIAVEPSHVDNIVNSVSITADIRKVESRQQIFTADNANGYQSEAAEDNYRVAANGSISIWLSLDDPTWTCSNPVLNGPANSSTFTAVDLSGNEVSSNVSATGTLFATSYKIDFINTNSFPVSINQITLWGEPAKLIGGQAVEYFATDDDSVSKFGTYQLDITGNHCFGSVENMKRYALDILNKYADYNAVVKLRAKCDPALQLGDVVQLALPNYTGRYTIRGIETQLTADGLSTTLTLNLLVSGEVGPFILDQSKLDGADLLG